MSGLTPTLIVEDELHRHRTRLTSIVSAGVDRIVISEWSEPAPASFRERLRAASAHRGCTRTSSYWAHLAINVRYALRWIAARETWDDVRFERRVDGRPRVG